MCDDSSNCVCTDTAPYTADITVPMFRSYKEHERLYLCRNSPHFILAGVVRGNKRVPCSPHEARRRSFSGGSELTATGHSSRK